MPISYAPQNSTTTALILVIPLIRLTEILDLVQSGNKSHIKSTSLQEKLKINKSAVSIRQRKFELDSTLHEVF